MKYWVIKIFHIFYNPLRKLYWFIFRPDTKGVKCLIENNSKFLLVKINYAHHRWTTPGGKVDTKESFLDAAIREAKEETGIDIKNPKFIGVYKQNIQYKNDTVEVYLGNSDKMDISIDPIEIEEAKWFSREDIPVNRSSSVDKVFKFYDQYRLNRN